MRVGAPGPAALQSQQQPERLDPKSGIRQGVMWMVTVIRHGGKTGARDCLENRRAHLRSAQITLGSVERTFKACRESVADLRASKGAYREKCNDIEQRFMAAKSLNEQAGPYAEFIVAREQETQIAKALIAAELRLDFLSERVATTRQVVHEAKKDFESLARRLG